MEKRETAGSDRIENSFQQESVWDYPRPPRLEATERHLRVVHAGGVVAETRRGMRILETSHPPVYYLPPQDVATRLMRPSARRGTFCEFKGVASYWDLIMEGQPSLPSVAWSYPAPSTAYAALKDYFAFYASMVDECWVDAERVLAQPGNFYRGWITSHVKGPFKGSPGTMGW
jgi:uncharacterized protein (DUF427 family)